MLLGVTAAANTIVTMTDAILKYRRELKAEHLTKDGTLSSHDNSYRMWVVFYP